MKKNETVLVTGSSRGIGKAVALKYAENAFNVVLNCKSDVENMKALETHIKTFNTNVISIQGDVSHYSEAEKIFDIIDKTFGGVDILINNAGISYVGLFNLMKPEQWQDVVNTNFCSVLNCSHLALQHMLRQRKGSIVNISSIWGRYGASCEAVYSATKGAIDSFTKALAKETAPNGIRVNAVSCGVINTDMNSFLDKEEKENLEAEIPMCRFGSAQEVAEAVYFLTSEKASYITGQILGADGGF